MTIDSEIKSFLSTNKRNPTKIDHLSGDASNRIYFRIYYKNTTEIFMDSRNEKESLKNFICVYNYLYNIGVSVPKISCYNIKSGFMLLEDFGDKSLYNIIENDLGNEYLQEIYSVVIDTICVIQSKAYPNTFPAYTAEKLVSDATEFLSECYHFSSTSYTSVEQEKNLLRETLYPIMEKAWSLPKVLSLRDVHSSNIMWLENRRENLRVGFLDFQDALIAPSSYDIVSLLSDARVDLNKLLVDKMINRYLENNPDISQSDFLFSYSALGFQRGVRIAGIFSNLSINNNKTEFASYLPRVWNQIFEHATHPGLNDLYAWLRNYGPNFNRKPEAKNES
tara:strand:- start:330 stop:1337 length:1008 start_codon:yes stop_codon:yes gene_type:complete